MDIRTAFPHEFISAADLRGQDVALTINSVTVEKITGPNGSDSKPVIRFRELEGRGEGSPTKMVLNRTNAKAIAKALKSHETNEWIGRRITLYPTTCMAFGDNVDCIRVRPKEAPPKRKRGAPQPEPEPVMPEPGETDDFDEEDLPL